MEPQPEKLDPDTYELDREAWNLPRPRKPAQDPQAPFSAQSEREDETPEAESEAV